MTMPTSERPTLDRHLHWMAEGHRYFLGRLERMSDEELLKPTALPGWTGRHLLSHIGHNAQALARLAHWACSGEPTPMYRSPSARADEIESGASWPAPELRAFIVYEHDQLVAMLAQLTEQSWRAQVTTAQGRAVSASTIPWLRSRELWIHATDLRYGTGFDDFPAEFLDELLLDVLIRRRSGSARAVSVRATDRTRPDIPEDHGARRVEGSAAELARWLTGRGGADVLQTFDGSLLPELSPWL
jgi:maleylpyruvate isomerase